MASMLRTYFSPSCCQRTSALPWFDTPFFVKVTLYVCCPVFSATNTGGGRFVSPDAAASACDATGAGAGVGSAAIGGSGSASVAVSTGMGNKIGAKFGLASVAGGGAGFGFANFGGRGRGGGGANSDAFSGWGEMAGSSIIRVVNGSA